MTVQGPHECQTGGSMHDFRDALMSVPVMIVVNRGTDQQLAWLNASARRAFGDRELIGKALLEAFPDLGPWSRSIIAMVSSGQPYVGIDEPITIDWSGKGKPETRYLTYVCQPTRAEDGTVDGSFFVAIDVTENVSARAQNPQDRAWMEAALDSIATPVLLADPETRRVIFVNAAARKLSGNLLRNGGPLATAVGAEMGYGTDAAGARIPVDGLPIARAARGEVVDGMELVWHSASGNVSLVCFAERVSAAGAFPSAIVVSLFEVSAARRVERELLEDLKSRDEFVTLIGHELRTPLTALRLQAQALLRTNPNAPGIAAVERATSRMNDLVERLLLAEELRDIGVRLAPEDVDLCQLVDETIDGLRVDAQRAGSPIQRDGAADVRGRWDRMRLQCVLAILIDNAIRFGAGKPVGVRCLDLGQRVSVAVSDAGIGIDPADHERIFRRFGRAAPSTHFGGLGLGLWLARDIVRRMGGSIVVSSSPGDGATFTIELPKTVA
jgi:signal transduction histidine kinase